MSKAIIWCRNEDNIVGLNGNLPWHISSDLKRFKRLTSGKSLIVGRKTYESFPNRTLPNRKIYILTNNYNYEVSDIENHFVISKEYSFGDDNVFIVGGASIYDMFLEDSDSPEYVLDFICDKTISADEDDVISYINKSLECINEKYELFKKYYFEDGISLNLMVKKNFKPDSFLIEIEEKL